MTTLSIKLEDQLAQWLKTRSAEAGQSPEELIRDTLRRRQKLDEFKALADQIHRKTLSAGYTSEEEIIETVLADRHAVDSPRIVRPEDFRDVLPDAS